MVPIWLLIHRFFFLTVGLSIGEAFKHRAWKKIIILLVSSLIWFFFPFQDVVLERDFQQYKPSREIVVKMVVDCTLTSNVKHNSSLIYLPEEFQHLSKGGGEIVTEKKGEHYSVLFFTNRGILDGFSCFVNLPEDKSPEQDDFDGDFKEIERLMEVNKTHTV